MTNGRTARAATDAAPVWLAVMPAHDAPRVWGRTPAERARRMASKMAIAGVLSQGDAWPHTGTVVLVAGDAVMDTSLFAGLVRRPGTAVTDAGGTTVLAAHVPAPQAPDAARWLGGPPPASGVAVLPPREVARGVNDALRKRTDPVCRRVGRDTAGVAERRLYDAAYKGVTDAVTRYVWPEPAFRVTRACARLGITPNAVTLAAFALMLVALALFWQGAYGWGLLAAWPMTFLDTVDGKLARVTLTSSPFGDMLDHITDILHPPAWYAAWGVGLGAAGAALPPGWLTPLLILMVAGYTGGRLCEGYFLLRFRMDIHVWRPFDSAFRLVTARRNPNLVLLTAFWLAGRPDWGLLAVTAWHLASDLIYVVRIARAEEARARGAAIGSWLRTAA